MKGAGPFINFAVELGRDPALRAHLALTQGRATSDDVAAICDAIDAAFAGTTATRPDDANIAAVLFKCARIDAARVRPTFEALIARGFVFHTLDAEAIRRRLG